MWSRVVVARNRKMPLFMRGVPCRRESLFFFFFMRFVGFRVKMTFREFRGSFEIVLLRPTHGTSNLSAMAIGRTYLGLMCSPSKVQCEMILTPVKTWGNSVRVDSIDENPSNGTAGFFQLPSSEGKQVLAESFGRLTLNLTPDSTTRFSISF